MDTYNTYGYPSTSVFAAPSGDRQYHVPDHGNAYGGRLFPEDESKRWYYGAQAYNYCGGAGDTRLYYEYYTPWKQFLPTSYNNHRYRLQTHSSPLFPHRYRPRPSCSKYLDRERRSRSHSSGKSRSISRSRSRSRSVSCSRSHSGSRRLKYKEPSILDAFRIMYLTPSKHMKSTTKFLATKKKQDRISEMLKSDGLGSKHWFFYPRNNTVSRSEPACSTVPGTRDNCDQRVKVDGAFFRKYKKSRKIDQEAPAAKLKRWELILYKNLGFVQSI